MSEPNYSTQRYRDFKKRGRCPACGAVRDIPGRINCSKCLSIARDRYYAKKKSEKTEK